MNNKELKTPLKTRILFGLLAFAMLFSTVAMYLGVIMSSSSKSSSKTPASEKIKELSDKINQKEEQLAKATAPLSDKYFETLKSYKKEVKAFNATTANNEGLKTKDLQVGTGRTLKAKDTNYLAFYIGFCADETVFDSSFDDFKNPKKLKNPLGGANLIKGWMEGIDGMKLGGIRQLSIPSELAYKEQEICGKANSPLKFIVLALEEEPEIAKLNKEIRELSVELQKLYLNIAQ